MSKPILYFLDWSPPVRTAALTAAALGVELETKQIDILNFRHLTPDFLEVSSSTSFFFIMALKNIFKICS